MKNDNNNNTIKIVFKPTKNYRQISSCSSPKKINNDKEKFLVLFKLNFPYNDLENPNPPKIINIKFCFYSYLLKEKIINNDISVDTITLYNLKYNLFHTLNDNDIFELKTTNNKKECPIIYYKINIKKIKVEIELYSKLADRFSFNLSETCSMFMLKYLIIQNLKLLESINTIKTTHQDESEDLSSSFENEIQNLITLKEIEKKIKLYGNGIINQNCTEYINKKETNRNFTDNTILSQIIEYYLYSANSNNNSFTSNNSPVNSPIKIKNNNINLSSYSTSKDFSNNLKDITLCFIMSEHTPNKLSIGLDFRFSILQYFTPFTLEIKNAKEIKDYDIIFNSGGLKLFVYCLNEKCLYNNNYFIKHFGYGNFDFFNMVKSISCPICKLKLNNLVQVKYIAMLNAKWSYKGYLSGLKYSDVEGKGFTILNDVLYRTDEFDFNKQFISLYFKVQTYFSKNQTIDATSHIQNENFFGEQGNKDLNMETERIIKKNKSYLQNNNSKKINPRIFLNRENSIKYRNYRLIKGKRHRVIYDSKMFNTCNICGGEEMLNNTCITF